MIYLVIVACGLLLDALIVAAFRWRARRAVQPAGRHAATGPRQTRAAARRIREGAA